MACPRPTKCLLAFAVVLVVGCGSSTSKPATTKTPAPAAAASIPLGAWVVKGSEEPGYLVASIIPVNAVQKVSQSSAQTATLTRDGFRRALIEHLNPAHAANPGGALSLVIELGSPAQPRHAQGYELQLTKSAQPPAR